MTLISPIGTSATEGGTPAILIADDSPTNVFVLAAMLRALGHASISAVDGAEAVRMAAECRPALILMDLQMPRMDGIAAAGRIRHGFGTGEWGALRPAIVAVTALADVRSRADFHLAGFDDVLLKPIELREVRAMVERWLPGPRAPA